MSLEIIAILRGITPLEVVAVGRALAAAGVEAVEVPLNSPEALASVAALRADLGPAARVGAGTVLTPDEARAAAAAGADFIVSPNCDAAVIRAAKAAGLKALPGVMTPTEAFAALAAGADGLKLFPGEIIGPVGLRAMRAVLPSGVKAYAVGGVSAENMRAWRAAGADGFGVGSALYRPGDSAEAVALRARALVGARNAAQGERLS